MWYVFDSELREMIMKCIEIMGTWQYEWWFNKMENKTYLGTNNGIILSVKIRVEG